MPTIWTAPLKSLRYRNIFVVLFILKYYICTVDLQVEAGATIELTFVDFNIENDNYCHDYVTGIPFL